MQRIFTYPKGFISRLLLPVVLVLITTMMISAQALHVIDVRNAEFIPDELTVMAGDTVEWRNTQGLHNVNGLQTVFPDNPESFGNEEGMDWTYQYIFNTAGTYDYQCDTHIELNMFGKITVIQDEKYMLTVEFSGMNPHAGQDLQLAVINGETGMELARVHTVAQPTFSVEVPELPPGSSYDIDFWADFNENGMYDGPPTDHAWRITLDEFSSDSVIQFVHNTTFTDIMWKDLLTLELSNMNPHVGQNLYLAVIEAEQGKEIGRVHKIVDQSFSVSVPGIEAGKNYLVDFWADFNENGMYDGPPTDHAWRINLNDVTGDTTLTFVHNTIFTDIMWKNNLTVEFSGMNPHAGQDLYLAVVDTATGKEVARTHVIAEPEFAVRIPAIEAGKSYYVDFWADFNENGMYDTPPTDHAWRLNLNSVVGDTALMFVHNTSFTDIMWKDLLTVNFNGMNPHVGQLFMLYVVDVADNMVVDSVTIDEIPSPDYSVHSASLEHGKTYHINFFADFNDNKMYDAPPTDHAWQMILENAMGDTTLTFIHNTSFTDIFPPTSAPNLQGSTLRVYPNPATDRLWIESENLISKSPVVSIFDITGRKVQVKNIHRNNRIELDVSNLLKGIYFIDVKTSTERNTIKLIKK